MKQPLNYCGNCLQDDHPFSNELFETGACHFCDKKMIDVIVCH